MTRRTETQRRKTGAKVERRKSIAEKRLGTVATAMELEAEMAKELPKGREPSLRKVAVALADAGHKTSTCVPYSPSAMKRMLGRQS